MAAPATQFLLSLLLIYELNCISLCNSPHGLAGCINQICEKKVCKTNPECCEKWDSNCAQIACHEERGICQSIGSSCNDDLQPCNIAHNSASCKQSECANKICEIKQDCCDKRWDSSCAQLACDTNHGLCSTINNACDIINKSETIHESRHLLQNCAIDPCPGHQERNPITCICECSSSDNCPGHQVYSGVLCECGCLTAPACTAPQLFNAISCACECPDILICGFAQQFDTETCKCMTPINDCSMDLCPGYQIRNPLSCDCECPTSIECEGNQQFNVFCECGCVSTPICKTPKAFNPTLCECECMDIIPKTCSSTQIFNPNTCVCDESIAAAALPASTSASLCSHDPCAGGIQQRNPNTCECECEEITNQCPGNQDFNILCECQCATTPICSTRQRFNTISCECECLNVQRASSKCGLHQEWNIDKCQCEDISSSVIITTSAVCPYANDACPGNQVRNAITCDCECANMVQCSGNQELNVFCECGCVATPICSVSQHFNMTSCACECSGAGIPTCNAADGRILNTNTCACDTIHVIQTTKITKSLSTTSTSSTTTTSSTATSAAQTTTLKTINTPTAYISKQTSTQISTHAPIISGAPTNLATLYSTNAPSSTPTDNVVHDPYTITKRMIVEIDGEIEEIEALLEGEEITLYEWSEIMIQKLIHYHDPIVSESVNIEILNVENTDNTVNIEYNLEMKRMEVFGLVLYHIDSSTIIAINDDWRFPVLSNKVVTLSSDTACVAIGDTCKSAKACCDIIVGDRGVLCVVQSELYVDYGVCCIDYNNYGCLRDSDCCYSNSYCVQNSGMCRRKAHQRNQEFKNYDASDSDESSDDQSSVDAVFMMHNKFDDGEYQNVSSNVAADAVVLLVSMKVLLCIVVILMIGNVIFCSMQEKCKKTKQTQAETKYADSKCRKKSIDINIIQ